MLEPEPEPEHEPEPEPEPEPEQGGEEQPTELEEGSDLVAETPVEHPKQNALHG